MLIALISDTHENLTAVAAAVDSLKARGAQRIIHAGDFIAPPTLKLICERSELPLDGVFGNNDGERFGLLKIAQACGNATLHGEFAELEIDSKKIFVTHYPIYAQHAAKAGGYDLCMHGHEHRSASTEKVGESWLVHPGTLLCTTAPMSYALYDTQANTVEIVEVAKAIEL